MSELQESAQSNDKPPASDTVLFIDWCVKRWEPFAKHVEEIKQGRAAYVLEREASYLKEVDRCAFATPEERAMLGAQLKYVFPTLMRTMTNLPLGVTDFEQIAAATSAGFDFVFEQDNKGCCRRHETPPSEEKLKFITPLAERAHASVLAYEKIVSR